MLCERECLLKDRNTSLAGGRICEFDTVYQCTCMGLNVYYSKQGLSAGSPVQSHGLLAVRLQSY